MTRVERPAPEGVLPSHLQHISASPADLQWRNPQRSLFYILNCGSLFVSTGTWQLYLKEFHSKPAEHYETDKTNLFSFLKRWSRPHPWNGSLSSFRNQGYTDSHCIFSYDSVTRESKADGTQGVHNLWNSLTQVKHFVKLSHNDCLENTWRMFHTRNTNSWGFFSPQPENLYLKRLLFLARAHR